MSTVYLLGAGASRGAGVPLATELTQLAVNRLNEQRELADVINYVTATMVAYQAQRGGRPDVLPNIEELVSAVELLSTRGELEIAPFVQQWSPAVDGLDRSRYVASGWESQLRRGILGHPNPRISGHAGQTYSRPSDSDLRRGLTNFLRQETKAGDGARFNELHQALLGLLVDLLRLSSDADLTYLGPLIETGRSAGGVTIATLNYDLVVETAAADLAVPCSTGVENWNRSGELDFGHGGIRLIKLHGSIDWERSIEQPRNQGRTGVDRVSLGDGLPGTGGLPFLIFGQREKLRPEGPFLDLRAEFVRRLRTSNHLVVVGYSFGDDHVNEAVAHWLNCDIKRKITVIDPAFPTTWGQADPRAQGFQHKLLAGLQQQASSNLADITVSRLRIYAEGAETALREVCAA